jgi:hypothetical protein
MQRRVISARERADRKRWLEEARKWDGVAKAFNPNLGRYITMDYYKARGAERVMATVDSLPSAYRALIYEFDHLQDVARGYRFGMSPEQLRKLYAPRVG